MKTLKCMSTLLFLLFAVSFAQASRILAIFPFNGKSHFIMTKALVNELLNKGHEVTFVTSFPMGKNLGPKYTEILIDEFDFWPVLQDSFHTNNIYDFANLSFMDFLRVTEVLGDVITDHALKQPKVIELFNRKDTKNVYDLLISEEFYQEAFLALSLVYDIPTITMSTFGYMNYMSQMMGIISPWSHVPHTYLPLTDKMNFWQRAKNTLANLYSDYHRNYLYFPKQDALVKKHLSHLPIEIPPVAEMEKNVSVILLNSYVPLTMPRPKALGMIEVGGLHIYPNKTLPSDIKKFLDEATHGTIYFSLGSNVQSADMPPEKMKIFIDVFASLKQRVLWKFEDDKIPNLPKNVMVKKWMPQNDILAHPNIKVFITHGGLFGSQEGVYYGVPLLGIPIYCDQFVNIKKATLAGYALTLDFSAITKENLKNSLTELLENPSYMENARRISQIFRDRPLSARDEAMYWVDYVIRYKGARHLRSAGLDLHWYQFYLLDVIGLFLGGVLTVFVSILLIIKLLVKPKKIKEKKM